jgi:hypothetical protein
MTDVKPPEKKKIPSEYTPMPTFISLRIRTTICRNLAARFDNLVQIWHALEGFGGDALEKDISMRRIFTLAAFGFGFYYLWTNTDQTTEFLAVGAMGFALLLEFIGAD